MPAPTSSTRSVGRSAAAATIRSRMPRSASRVLTLLAVKPDAVLREERADSIRITQVGILPAHGGRRRLKFGAARGSPALAAAWLRGASSHEARVDGRSSRQLSRTELFQDIHMRYCAGPTGAASCSVL